MKLGFNIGHEVQKDGVGMRRLATTVDDCGYHSLWTSEHIAIPATFHSNYSYSRDGRPQFPVDGSFAAGLLTLSHVAAVTSRVRLGTGVIPMFCHHPVALAKDAATVDRLSGGRLDLGVGAGWLTEEAALLGNPTDHRGARLDEAIDVMRGAWSEQPFEHHGTFWSIPPTYVQPPPLCGARVPIWIGGSGPRRLRTVVDKDATGAFLASAEVSKVKQVRAALPATKHVGIFFNITHDYEVGPISQRLDELQDAGADIVVLSVNRYQDDALSTTRTAERFAREMLHRYL